MSTNKHTRGPNNIQYKAESSKINIMMLYRVGRCIYVCVKKTKFILCRNHIHIEIIINTRTQT